MQAVCKVCKGKHNVSLFNYCNVWINRKKRYLCDRCQELDDWKKDQNIFGKADINYFGDILRIKGYDLRIVQWIRNKAIRPKNCCEITLQNDTILIAFPIDTNEYYLKYNVDNMDEYKIHVPGKQVNDIALKDIKKIKIIDVHKDYVPEDVTEPIYGYKGVYVSRGILGDNKYIYDLGIPYIEPKRSPYKYDFQDVYSHFCLNMEDVYLHFGRDYIQESLSDYKYCIVKLFLVKAEGHCHHYTKYGWVSNHLTLVREITQNEIIEYYEKNLEILSELKNKLFKDHKKDDIWEQFKVAKIEPYIQATGKNSIEQIVIQNCEYRKVEECQQDQTNLSLEKCKTCTLKNFITAYESMRPEYAYLICRSDILEGKFSENSEEYRLLQENRHKIYKEAIDRCRQYYGKD